MDPEKLLWQLSHAKRQRETKAISDEMLRAYRDGTADAKQNAEIERLLGDNDAARVRLAELAGVNPQQPPAHIRQTVLDALEGDTAASRPSHRASQSPVWRVAAALLAVTILAPVAIQFQRDNTDLTSARTPHTDWASTAQFDVQMSGLASQRSQSNSSVTGPQTPVLAYSDTQIALTVQAAQASTKGLDYGLYRAGDGLVQRLRRGVDLERLRGAARISARAGDLVGSTPGTYRLYLVVANGTPLPDSHAVHPPATPYDTLSTSSTKVYEQVLTLLEQ